MQDLLWRLVRAITVLLVHTDSTGARYHQSAARDGPLPPSQDPFYVIPSNISRYHCGAVLRARPVSLLAFGHLAGTAEQLFYKTTGSDNESDGTVTTLITPRIALRGKPKLLAIAAATDAASQDCAPSYSFTSVVHSRNSPLIRLLTDPYITAALHRGYHVAIADYLGSKSAFLSTVTEGRGLLDGIRAVTQHQPTLAHADVVVIGYSGGAHASAAAAQLWPTYAPDVQLRGIAIGGLPADLRVTLGTINGGRWSGLAYTGAVGLATTHRDLDGFYQSELNDEGRRNFTKIKQGEWCVPQAVINLNGVDLSSAFHRQGALRAPVSLKAFEAEKLGRGGEAIEVPAYIFHSTSDDTVPFGQASEYVHLQCDRGAKIRFETKDGLSHLEAGLWSMPPIFDHAQQFLESEAGSTTKRFSCAADHMRGQQDDTTREAAVRLMGVEATEQISMSMEHLRRAQKV
ncbi:unnamed protein product [Parajaminaea phylloscopi]